MMPTPTNSNTCTHQPGFTLIELMVALLISMILLGGVSVVLVSTNKANRLQTGTQVLNESGRFAVELMSRDIRMAGYTGCARDLNSMDGDGPVFTNVGSGFSSFSLHGFEFDASAPGTWHPASASLSISESLPSAASSSDSLIVRMAVPILDSDGATATLSANMSSSGDPLQVTDTRVITDNNLMADDVMMVGNCESADIFSISGTSDRLIEHESSPFNNRLYDANAELYKFYSIRYAVQKDPDNNNIPTLFRDINNSGAEALIPGVENMQIMYGEDTGGTRAPDVLRNALNVFDWSGVRTVKISLLLRTEQAYGFTNFDRNAFVNTGSENYMVVGDYNFPDDGLRVRRRLFETTVHVRNNF